jgi:hypothetical protein
MRLVLYYVHTLRNQQRSLKSCVLKADDGNRQKALIQPRAE